MALSLSVPRSGFTSAAAVHRPQLISAVGIVLALSLLQPQKASAHMSAFTVNDTGSVYQNGDVKIGGTVPKSPDRRQRGQRGGGQPLNALRFYACLAILSSAIGGHGWI